MSASMEAMDADTNPGDDADPDEIGSTLADDETTLAGYAEALADGIVTALPGWVVRCVESISTAAVGRVEAGVRAEAERAGAAAAQEVGPQVRALLALPVDEQWTNPLALVRNATAYPTAVLRAAGVPGVVRDAAAVARFPDDEYDLCPTSFAELDPALADAGVRWGAAKAHVFLRKRRLDGQR